MTRILPVIHVEDLEQAQRNASVSFEAGVDGIWLINHTINAYQLLRIFRELRVEFPKEWIGVNLLDAHPIEAMRIMDSDFSGLWVDNAHILEDRKTQKIADLIRANRPPSWQGRYYGGVAFKGQRGVLDLEAAARIATQYVDVITTSGKTTGSAPSVEKLQSLRAGAGDHPIAVASGITSQNVEQFLPFIDDIMVASGISKSFTEIDSDLLKELVSTVRSSESQRTLGS